MIELKQKFLNKYKVDEIKLDNYFNICIDNNLHKHTKFVTELHHILPVSLFPEYQDLKKYKWNGTYLTYINHYKIHALLADMTNIESMISAWWGMNNKNQYNGRLSGPVEIIGEKLYSELRKKAIDKISQATSNKVVVKEVKSNSYVSVPVYEYHKNKNLYKHKSSNTVTVKEKGICKTIAKEEFDKGPYKGVAFDTVAVTNILTNENSRITNDDFVSNKYYIGTANTKFYFIDNIPMRSFEAEEYIKKRGYKSQIHNFEIKKNKLEFVKSFKKISMEEYKQKIL